MSRLTDDTKVINEFISQKLPQLLPAVITLIGYSYVVHYGLANDIINIYCNSDIYGNNDSIRSQNAKISMNTQTEIANFSGLLGRVLTEMRLVKVSNTERQELNNAHSNLREIYNLGLRQAKITAVIQPISSVIMLLMIAVILGFGAIRIATGAITAGALIAMIFM